MAHPIASSAARFADLGPDFSDPVTPARFPAPVLRWRNDRWAAQIGLDGLDAAAFEAHFARFEPLPGNMPQPLAMRYHGHQFGVYNPDLGDGRGFLFAQLRDREGRLLDLATKGSGQTPWSRAGDGRLTLKGAVREILAAQMLEAQGVYTSKPFAVFETGEALTRNDEPSPTRAAVLTRLGHSHIRFGTFQRHAYEERPDRVAALVAHCAAAYYPDLLELDPAAQAEGLLLHAIAASAHLCAGWMAAGFVHGVLNTDNMNVTGESFDYGPWRFLTHSDPGFTAAYFDQQGRYAFGRQPHAVGWNLAQLATALSLVAPAATLEAALTRYAPTYQTALREAMFARLALEPGDLDDDITFLAGLFQWMTDSGAPWAQVFHDWFAGPASAHRADDSPIGSFYGEPEFLAVRAGLMERAPVRPERLDARLFQRPHPPTLVIEEVEALWAPIAEDDDWERFEAKIDAIEDLRCALDLTPRWVRAMPAAPAADV
ncbi:MAG: YdiU family protein [Hyphomonadaceae bacterium]|nr:YdiU family protein [Hyphomonadaceae bacterium]